MTEKLNGHYSNQNGHAARSEHWKNIKWIEQHSEGFMGRSRPSLEQAQLTTRAKKRRFTGGNSPKRPAGPGSPYKPLF